MAKRTHRGKTRARPKKGTRAAPGAPPDTLAIGAEARTPTIQVIAYGPTDLLEEVTAHPDRIREIAGKYPTIWVNVDGFGDVGVIRAIGEIFGIHPLALADAVTHHQRAKFEAYPDHLYVVARMPSGDGEVGTEQVSLILGRGFVVSFQEELPGDAFEPVRQRIRRGGGTIRTAEADHLLYALLDATIDAYFPVLEVYNERLELLEDELASVPPPDTMRRIHATKRDLRALRRALWPKREALTQLIREPSALVSDDTRLYLRDCGDHVFQILDLVEACRELSADLTEIYLSSVNNRMSEVMKVLTIIATLFIPLTFIVGVYGMNFDSTKSPWNMPELGWYWGYPAVLGLMAAVSIGMLAYFRRKGWLGG